MTMRKQDLRARRKKRIRKAVEGTTERPRLSVHRSSRHLYAQVIDDSRGVTLASIHSYDESSRANRGCCEELGKKLAQVCAEKKISKVVFDKNGYSYHGRLKAFADGARSAGLDF